MGLHEMIDRLLLRADRDGDGIPDLPWVMFQSWQTLLFMSWRIPEETLRPHVPDQLEIDQYDGQCWISMLPMHMVDLHLRGLPPIPGTSDFPEINLRTYVRAKGLKGVYFLSIDAESRLGSWAAEHFFDLPYVYADMSFEEKDGVFAINSERAASDDFPAAVFRASYKPTGEPREPEPGSLDEFLVERYWALAISHGHLHGGRIQHDRWKLQDVEFVDVQANTILAAAGFEIDSAPDSVHFSPGTDSLCWPMVPVDRD